MRCLFYAKDMATTFIVVPNGGCQLKCVWHAGMFIRLEYKYIHANLEN